MLVLNKLFLFTSILFLICLCKNKEIKKEVRFEDFRLKEECYIKSDDDIVNLAYRFYEGGQFPSFSMSMYPDLDFSKTTVFISENPLYPFKDLKYYTLIKDEDEVISIDGCLGRELIYNLNSAEPSIPFDMFKLGYISKLDYFILMQKKSTLIKSVVLERNGKKIVYKFPMKN
jgi:hypothetical protein